MTRTAVINVVGLTESLLGEATPRINAFLQRGAKARIVPAFPAVTCAAQSNYLTGLPPARHGIVGNGWYDRELAEVQFWKQSNRLVRARKLWEDLRAQQPGFTCAKLFWWYNMYSTADYSITPRPIYRADGRKVFDIHTWPYSIRTEIKQDLGDFPFATFWGPAAGVKSPQGAPDAASRWIAESAKWIENKYQPTLNLIYLPHLDYALQRHGPFVRADSCSSSSVLLESADASDRGRGTRTSTKGPPGDEPYVQLNPAILPDLRAIDAIVGDLIGCFHHQGVQVVLLSEYGISNVTTPIHLNRLFRQQGWLTVKDELGLEMLDCGASRAFAVADHQVAHIYLQDPSLESAVRSLLERQPGLHQVLGEAEQAALRINHPRAGDLLAVAKADAWFTYYYWLDDARAPDFARTVDIHRKPGYDPVELFLDPARKLAKARIAWRLLKKRLGFRTLMDVIPLDATLVKGSHGRRPESPADWPILISENASLLPEKPLDSTDVYSVLRRHLLA